MKSICFLSIGAVALIVMVGCTNPINMHTARKYAVQGQAAAKDGDWAAARKNFGRAIANVRMGHGDDKMLAVLYYEYGRASGVICDWPEAERGLNEAYNLDQQTQGPSYMSLIELARLNLDRKQYEKAVEYFDRAMPDIDKHQMDTRDPLGYADFLDEYATGLEKMGKQNR